MKSTRKIILKAKVPKHLFHDTPIRLVAEIPLQVDRDLCELVPPNHRAWQNVDEPIGAHCPPAVLAQIASVMLGGEHVSGNPMNRSLLL